MNINDEAKNLIQEILKETNDSDKLGKMVNELSDLFWKGADCTLVNDFYNQCSEIVHYRSLVFVVDEGPFEKCPKVLPTIKKLLCNKDREVIGYAIYQYALLLETNEELNKLFSFLESGEYLHRLKSMVAMVAIAGNKQRKHFANFDTQDKLNIFKLLDSKNSQYTAFRVKQEIAQCDNEVTKKLLFIYALIKEFSVHDLKEIAHISGSIDIFDYYYLYCDK